MLPASSQVLPEKKAFQRLLLRWYSRSRRDLPWRQTGDPYRVFISEFMLQQTRVETVIPYYERFLRIFPDLGSLARAPLSKVLRAWAGLGYYARARSLHAAARLLIKDKRGIPSDPGELIKLPGIGSYTAGAVASMAFNRPVPALDGNARRVIGRLFSAGEDTALREKGDRFWKEWVPARRPGDFNQALMDLGAMICTPSRPRCRDCPVEGLCRSRGELPQKRPQRKEIRKEKWLIALVERDGKVMIHRKEGGILAGLWQFPTLALKAGEGGDERDLLEKYLEGNFGMKIQVKGSLPFQDYFFTHLQALMKPYRASLKKDLSGPPFPCVRWIHVSRLSRVPVSTAMRKVAALLSEKKTPGRKAGGFASAARSSSG